uniref:Ig-like domain-containing protein n=1 Tax=Pundamilia nyererei TaxID=303518 RepID=A0A3B4FNM2_9CICH
MKNRQCLRINPGYLFSPAGGGEVTHTEKIILHIFYERVKQLQSEFSSSCITPVQMTFFRDLIVHSFYHNKDQLERQNQCFRGRTSLFSDQISTGNASLQLTKVEVQDEGKYKCYTSTIDGNKESFINLKIDGKRQKLYIYSRISVSCIFMERCLLPCSYDGTDVTQIIIHWFKMSGDIHVHSFYNNKDQHGYQDQRFRDRTSLFKDQISKGNVSLQLAGVKVQDEGRYKCHISTLQGNRDSFINLNVNVCDWCKLGCSGIFCLICVFCPHCCAVCFLFFFVVSYIKNHDKCHVIVDKSL